MAMSCSSSSVCKRTPSSKFRLNRSMKATAMVSPGRATSTSCCQPERARERPDATVAVYQVGPDAVFVEEAELGLQVPGLVVGLADPGVAVGDGVVGHLELRRQ